LKQFVLVLETFLGTKPRRRTVMVLVEGILNKWNFFKLLKKGANSGRVLYTYI
jgi:hypothetical protein